MVSNVIVPTDHGPGDGGKGGVVHRLCCDRRVHTVLKEGMFCGNHGICTATGQRYAFSLWGCGTLGGVRTHFTQRFVASAVGLLNEARDLRYLFGIHDPFELLTIDERTLFATSYHGFMSRLKELALGKNPRGTVGTGAGAGYRDAQRVPELALYARDLSRPDLRDRLAAVREQVIRDLEPIIQNGFLPEDQEAADQEISHLYDDGFLEYVVDQFRQVARLVKVVGPEYLGQEILSKDGVVVVEKSHGILTDHYQGFHPHTSAIRTLPSFTRSMLEEAEYRGRITDIAVHRAYQIRHGAGPMPTHDPAMGEHLLPGSNKDENRYQGKVRVGPLDLVMLRYALACAGPMNGLALTWFDQVQLNGEWNICHRYRGADDPRFFTPEGEIKVRQGDDEDQLAHQEALGKALLEVTPEITTYPISKNASREELYKLCTDILQEHLGIPVRMISFGPTERDKLCK
ncbi:adenylosuccinate synthetase [Candidatus Uhrbacteria bacterium]|nr:adenylosuccinate synthetase [Candidatus Uhrbacteria bacterium]